VKSEVENKLISRDARSWKGKRGLEVEKKEKESLKRVRSKKKEKKKQTEDLDAPIGEVIIWLERRVRKDLREAI
jgi:hypothetical protein